MLKSRLFWFYFLLLLCLLSLNLHAATPNGTRPTPSGSSSVDITVNELNDQVVFLEDLLLICACGFAFFRGVTAGGSLMAAGFNRGNGEM